MLCTTAIFRFGITLAHRLGRAPDPVDHRPGVVGVAIEPDLHRQLRRHHLQPPRGDLRRDRGEEAVLARGEPEGLPPVAPAQVAQEGDSLTATP